MRALLASGADPSLATNENTTPLMVAAGLGRIVGETRIAESSALEAVKLAVALGADVNANDQTGETAVHGTAYIGADSILQFLVDQGAKVNVRNKKGQTPLTIAQGIFQSGAVVVHKSTVALLLQLGADPQLGKVAAPQ
jgi:ankyrin repeat protein